MNLFVTDRCPIRSAEFLDDKRVIKMCLETAQLLSTTMNFYNIKGPYRTTHLNHPISIWVRHNRSNYIWALRHFKALCDEYTNRYGKVHKCMDYYEDFKNAVSGIPEGDQTDFINCTTFKDVKDTTEAYMLYLNEKWNVDVREPTWYRV